MKLKQRISLFASSVVGETNHRIRQHSPLIVAAASSFLLAFTLTLALVSNRSLTSAEETQINVSTTQNSVALYADGIECNGSTLCNTYDTTVVTSADGNVSSVVSNIRVVSSSAYGYQLSLKANAANMVGTADTDNKLTPLANATVANPTNFTPGSCNSWGFATPSSNGSKYSTAFDSSYQIQNSKPVSQSNGRYAAVPTGDTLIHESTKNDETRPYYFAACVNNTMPADTYSATVTWSAVAVDSAQPSGSVIVDIDPNMIPIRWNYEQCTYGNGSGNVLDASPNAPITPTNPLTTACWVKADPSIYNTGTNADWYNYTTDNTATRDAYGQPYYTNRKMANAVTFTNATALAQYQAAAVGTPIPDGDIGGYWTYLPRYEYKVENFNYKSTNYPHAFDVRLTNKNLGYTSVASIDTSLDPSTSPQYLTPPAFTWPDGAGGVAAELNGIWFGKYETTGTTANPTIKPGVPSIVSQTNSTFFQMGLQFGNPGITGSVVTYAGGNQHNFANTAKTNSHMSKNSEWGALVYFTNSMYGVCSNMNCTSDNQPSTGMATTAQMERTRNNAKITPYTTGCGANVLDSIDDAATSTCNLYNTQLGVLASISHNVYGMYDVAGGVWEYTSGNYVTGSGTASDVYTPTNASANYTNLVDMFQTDANVYIPYFEAYPNPPVTGATNGDITNGKYGDSNFSYDNNSYWRIYNNKLGLGQAIFEASGWSGVYATSVLAPYPWFHRGGRAGDTPSAGVESINDTDGDSHTFGGTRSIVNVVP